MNSPIVIGRENKYSQSMLDDIYLGITLCDKKIKNNNEVLENTDCSELEVEYLKYVIKLVQLQKLIFQSALKDNNSILFPKFLGKCDEIIGDILDISSQRVILGEVNEGQHLTTCNTYMRFRENTKYFCEYFSRKNK
jgi:hypothetical protein